MCGQGFCEGGKWPRPGGEASYQGSNLSSALYRLLGTFLKVLESVSSFKNGDKGP